MSAGADSIVQFDNVGLRYGTDREVLSDISFTLYPGSFYFLTGASGAGKTSMLKLLYLAQRPTRGAIRMFGQDLITQPRNALPDFRRRIGTVFQDFRLIPHLTAFDNVALPLRITGMSESELQKPVSDMLNRPVNELRAAVSVTSRGTSVMSILYFDGFYVNIFRTCSKRWHGRILETVAIRGPGR